MENLKIKRYYLVVFLVLKNINFSGAEILDHRRLQTFSKFISSFSLGKGFDSCGTWITVEGSFQLPFSTEMIPSLTILEKDSSRTMHEFFSHEWSYDELKTTVSFGHLKHMRNCGVSLIDWYSESYVENEVSNLLWKRYTRAASDYFIFIKTEDINKKDYNIWTKLAKRAILNCNSDTKCVLENVCSHGYSDTVTEKCLDFVQGKNFEVAITFAAPLVSFKKLSGGEIEGRGVQYKMLETAARHFNHTFGMHVSFGRGTGSRLPNGSCIGTSGEIFYQRGDIGFPLGNSLTRQKVMDATTVFEYTRLTFVYRNPSPQSKWQALFWSFPSNVWLAISVTFVILIPILWLILAIDPNLKNRNKLRESIYFLAEIFLEQDSSLVGNAKMKSSFRMFALTWMSASLILGTAYRSKLVSFLTFPFLEEVPTTFQKLADSDYKVNFKYYGGLAYRGFQTSNVPSYRKIFTRLNMEKDLYKCMEGVILADKTVCVVYLEAASYMTANNFTLSASSSHSIIGVATEFGLLVPLVFAFRKGSPLTALYNDLTGIFKASGLHDEWMRKDLTERKKISADWLTSKDAETTSAKVKKKIVEFFENLDISLKPLFIKNLIGPFALLCIGLVFSILVFIKELFRGQCRKRNFSKSLL